MERFYPGFSIAMDKDAKIHHILSTVYQALEEKGYNPINQIVGYILSERSHLYHQPHGAAPHPQVLDRDELLQVLVRRYLGQ